MNCPRHPHKLMVTNCRECGSGFCIECVRETDQTILCPECLRRTRSDMAREHDGAGGAGSMPSEERGGAVTEAHPALSGKGREAAGGRVAATEKPEAGGGKEPAASAAGFPAPGIQEPRRGRSLEAKAAPEAKDKAREAGGPAVSATPSEAGFAVRDIMKGIKARKVRSQAPDATGGAEGASEPSVSDFLSRGPDDDFSILEGRKGGAGIKRRASRKSAWKATQETGIAGAPKGAGQDGSSAAALPVGAKERMPSEAGAGGREKKKATKRGPSGTGRGRRPRETEKEALASEDALLRDVVSALLMPEGAAAVPRQAADAVAEGPPAPVSAPVSAKGRRKKRERAGREERAERWAFLAQPRSSEYTMIALTWWGAALFIAAVLLGGAALWATVNAYLIPRDTEYGALAIVIGVLIGLAFWRKADRKHGTKLAVQASIVTFFSLFLGEFLHWFLIIVKNKAFRAIFFDLVSFKFIWENGAEIMRNVIEAMFPTGFLLLLILPTVAAFIITFGMPPIPEVFVQFWRALRGETVEREEARHGLEG